MNELTYEILFRDADEFEYVLVEIIINGQRIYHIDREDGLDKINVTLLTEFYINQPYINLRYPMDKLFKILEIGRNELLNYYK
jgi:hypothetical protein